MTAATSDWLQTINRKFALRVLPPLATSGVRVSEASLVHLIGWVIA